jgi:predicted DNA repair protein MutK
MPTPGLLGLVDDIATLLDDVSVMTQAATKKTAGVIGDDLALNADQVTGMRPDRELPVVWAVAKGALLNKAILVPAALLISAFVPQLITWLLLLGGLYLCYEGTHKVLHKWLGDTDDEAKRQQRVQALADRKVDLVAFERERVKGAIRTDFILSAEIIVIALGTMGDATLPVQALTLAIVGFGVTAVVYGPVAGLVRLDDIGLRLQQSPADEEGRRTLGRLLLAAAPRIMKTLSVVGTIAMFLVGGGIVAHAVPPVEHLLETAHPLVKTLGEGVTGVVAGLVLVGIAALVRRVRGGGAAAH